MGHSNPQYTGRTSAEKVEAQITGTSHMYGQAQAFACIHMHPLFTYNHPHPYSSIMIYWQDLHKIPIFK